MHKDGMKEEFWPAHANCLTLHKGAASFFFLSRMQTFFNRQKQQFGIIAPQL